MCNFLLTAPLFAAPYLFRMLILLLCELDYHLDDQSYSYSSIAVFCFLVVDYPRIVLMDSSCPYSIKYLYVLLMFVPEGKHILVMASIGRVWGMRLSSNPILVIVAEE